MVLIPFFVNASAGDEAVEESCRGRLLFFLMRRSQNREMQQQVKCDTAALVLWISACKNTNTAFNASPSTEAGSALMTQANQTLVVSSIHRLIAQSIKTPGNCEKFKVASSNTFNF